MIHSIHASPVAVQYSCTRDSQHLPALFCAPKPTPRIKWIPVATPCHGSHGMCRAMSCADAATVLASAAAHDVCSTPLRRRLILHSNQPGVRAPAQRPLPCHAPSQHPAASLRLAALCCRSLQLAGLVWAAGRSLPVGHCCLHCLSHHLYKLVF